MPPIGYVSQGRPGRVAGEVSWEVREIEGLVGLSGCAKALRIAVVSGLLLLVALPATASAASTAEIFNGFVRVNGDDGINEIEVTLSGGTYTISDTSGITPVAGGGCIQVGTDVTCSGPG